MASIQCHKPANEPCHQQKCSNHSLTSWFKGNNQTHCTTQTQPQAQPCHNHAASSITHTQTHCAMKTHEGHNTHKHTQPNHASNGLPCQGKTKKKERNLFLKIKDGLSGNDSCSDSSSDSESDNEGGCNTRSLKKK